MSTISIASSSYKAKAADSGGAEGRGEQSVFGAPESWSFGDLLSIGVRVVRANARLAVILALVAAVGVGIDHVLWEANLLQSLCGMVVGTLWTGATAMTVLEGREDLEFDEVSSRYGSRVAPLFGTSLLAGFSVGALLLVVGAVAGGLHVAGLEGLAIAVGVTAALALCVVILFAIELMMQAVVLGDRSGFEALTESFELARTNLLGVVGSIFAVGMMTRFLVLITVLLALVPTFGLMAVTPEAGHSLITLVLAGLGAAFGAALGLWNCSVFALVYLRARAQS